MSKSVNSDIILEGQKNWEIWLFIIKRLAEAGDVWQYIDPEQPHRSLQKSNEPVRPSPTVNTDGSVTQPSQAALSQFNININTYYKDIKEYRRLQDKLG